MLEIHVSRPQCHSLPGAGQGTPDDVLIQRIAKGNRLAMEALYLRHRLQVYRQIVKLVGDRTTAEDLLSDTFLDVWRRLSRDLLRIIEIALFLAITHSHVATVALPRNPPALRRRFCTVSCHPPQMGV